MTAGKGLRGFADETAEGTVKGCVATETRGEAGVHHAAGPGRVGQQTAGLGNPKSIDEVVKSRRQMLAQDPREAMSGDAEGRGEILQAEIFFEPRPFLLHVSFEPGRQTHGLLAGRLTPA